MQMVIQSQHATSEHLILVAINLAVQDALTALVRGKKVVALSFTQSRVGFNYIT